MFRKRWLTLGAWALLAGGASQADAQAPPPGKLPAGTTPPPAGAPAPPPRLLQQPPAPATPGTQEGGGAREPRQKELGTEEGTPPAEGGYGPTPLPDVKILQNLIFGKQEKPCLTIAGWADFDYTYRSTGSGLNMVAPV